MGFELVKLFAQVLAQSKCAFSVSCVAVVVTIAVTVVLYVAVDWLVWSSTDVLLQAAL